MKEPLLWFVILGAIIFAADSYLSARPDQVIVDTAVRSRLATLWQTQTGKPATNEELESLIENWVREEVLFREAKQLGLDRDDSIVRRRLVQKLSFLVEEVDGEDDPILAVENYYRENIEIYSLPVRYSFSQIFFSDASLADELQSALADGGENHWRDLGETSMLNASYVNRSEKEVMASFGREFTAHLDDLQSGRWIGPIKSSFGFHLVRLEQIRQKEAAPFATIEKRVRADYQRAKTDAALATYYQDLSEKYDVVYQ
ncbi:MAG: peptidylprolyl isomerase [bacterium]|nr:peptidyl-prolyl cis-trans isomerase [Gammaproteobacteria bacterium]